MMRWMRAKENNPTFLEQRQNVLEAEQNVDKTKKESRFNASFNASVNAFGSSGFGYSSVVKSGSGFPVLLQYKHA